MSHRQRRIRGGDPQREQDNDRLQQILDRLHSSLQLGLRPSPLQKDGRKKWSNTDAEVQLQAVRAIAAFVSALASIRTRQSTLQSSVEDSVAALEALLMAERESVSSLAAHASTGLATSFCTNLLTYGGQRLVGPLLHVLSSSPYSAAISAATALHGILVQVKPRAGISVLYDSMWRSLEDAHALDTIVDRLQGEGVSNEKDLALSIALTNLLAVILERWPVARYRVGCNISLRESLLLRCMSNNHSAARGALHASSAIALCASVAASELKDAGILWESISTCLHPSKPPVVQVEALRFLTILARAPKFGSLFGGPHVDGIVKGCLQALEQLRTTVSAKWSPEVEGIVLEAAVATSSLLSWPGQHHNIFIERGIENLLLDSMMGLKDLRTSAKQDAGTGFLDKSSPAVRICAVDVRSRGSKLNPRLRPLLWEILGWLGAHLDIECKGLSGELPALACNSLLRALNPRGQSLSWLKHEQKAAESEAHTSGQELVQISKAVLLLLSSPSKVVSSSTKNCLKDALLSTGINWASLVETLSIGNRQNTAVKSDNLQTLALLLALACVSWLQVWQEELLRCNALDIVFHIIKAHGLSADEHHHIEGLSAVGTVANFGGAKACCEDVQRWEGTDSVLFTALWACAKLLPGSTFAREVTASLSKSHLEDFSQMDVRKQELLSLLWALASENSRAGGVRWWAVCCLASFGIYGFPSSVGKDMQTALNDPKFADMIFILGDGSRLYAHRIVLEARCKSLLPAPVHGNDWTRGKASSLVSSMSCEGKASQVDNWDEVVPTKQVSNMVPTEVHVSSRLTFTTLRTILEYAYVGYVKISLEELDALKPLARRCEMEPLTTLLEGKSPCWRQPVGPCDLSSAFANGNYYWDMTLQVKPNHAETGNFSCSTCMVTNDHLHAHHVVLACRCDYFQALFRSGMRDSALEIIKISATKESIRELLFYLYRGQISVPRDENSGCAWRHLSKNTQLDYLLSLVKLAELAGQWMLDDLQEQCRSVIISFMKENVHLCPAILTEAASGQQFVLVEACASCLGPKFLQMRDLGALDNLDEDLTNLIRAAHVKLSLSGIENHDQAGAQLWS